MSGVHTMEGRASLSHRLGLGIILLFQITIIPIIGFSLTYLIKIDRENFDFDKSGIISMDNYFRIDLWNYLSSISIDNWGFPTISSC